MLTHSVDDYPYEEDNSLWVCHSEIFQNTVIWPIFHMKVLISAALSIKSKCIYYAEWHQSVLYHYIRYIIW